MKLTKAQKREVSRQMAELLGKANSVYFTQYQGLKFVELADLRKKLRPLACRYQVVKNSLVAHALKDSGIAGVPEATLQGPVGLVLGQGSDFVAVAKVLAAFSKEFSKLQIRGGYVDGAWVSGPECAHLATLGTKVEMLAGLAGALYSVLSQSVSVLQAPLRDLVLVLKDLHAKKGGEAPAAA